MIYQKSRSGVNFVLFIAIFLFFSVMPKPSFSQERNKQIDVMAEAMPRFPGCEDIVSIQEKNKCANQKFTEYIYSNLNYPPEAIKNGVEGRVTVRFTVKKDSSISNIEIGRDIGSGCGEEAKRVIESMNNMPSKWIPGIQDGKKVDIHFTVPVVFKLSEIKKRKN